MTEVLCSDLQDQVIYKVANNAMQNYDVIIYYNINNLSNNGNNNINSVKVVIVVVVVMIVVQCDIR